MRVLTWYCDPIVDSSNDQPPVYCLEADYAPERVMIKCSTPSMDELEIDIKSDGVSIFSETPKLQAGDAYDEFLGEIGRFSGSGLGRDAWITCHVISTGGAGRICVSLELEEE